MPELNSLCGKAIVMGHAIRSGKSAPGFTTQEILMLAENISNAQPTGTIGEERRIMTELAPEGKVAVWLQGSGSEPNYRVTPSVLKTVSGDKLGICKGITKSDFSYGCDKDIKDFIKGKNILTIVSNYPLRPKGFFKIPWV